MAQIKPLPEQLQKIAIEELKEIPSRLPEDLQALRTWIEQQPHLKARTNDQFLIQFLRGCKYSLVRAKEKIDLYFTLKTKYPQIFGLSDLDEEKFKHCFNLGCFTFLPRPLHDNGPRIVIIQINYSTAEASIEDIFYVTCPMYELALLNDPYAGIQGLVYVFDMGKMSFGHLLQASPNFFKQSVLYMEKSMPLRIRGIYFINAPVFAQHFFKLLLPLLSEKLRNRVHILGSDITELTKHIPQVFLPEDVGGQNGQCSELTRNHYKMLQSYRDYFKENSQYGTDESLRPDKPLSLDDHFGVGGSFRILAVD
uniref:CRAL-TRIO domain-containing protein n=1 Tax=Stomoxys calcitrans TaxID=35570 RepID=A0A1I8Q142_STOCA